MNETLAILTKMDWPAALALIGMCATIGIPIMVRRVSRRIERIEELKLKRAIQLEQFKKGALTYTEEL